MKPIRKTDRRGNVYYKIGAVDGFHEDGTQYRKFTNYYPEPGMSRTDIERELRIRQSEWELKVRQMHDEERKKGVPRNKGKQTFADYADAYMTRRTRNKDIKAGTVDNYSNYLDGRLKDVFGNKAISDITTAQIDDFLSSLRKEGMRKNGGSAMPVTDLTPILKEKGLTRVAVARQTGLSADTVELVVKTSKKPSSKTRFALTTASQIAAALGEPVDNLFRVEQNMNPLADKTILENYNLLRAIFGYAKRKGHITINPMEAVDRPKYKRTKVKALTREELLAVHEALMVLPESKLRWKIFLTLLIVTASRRGEIAGLQWRHIDFENGILLIEQQLVGTRIEMLTDSTKEDDYRPIKLADEVVQMLKEYRVWYEAKRKSYILPDGTDLWRVGTTKRTENLQRLFPAEPIDAECPISGNDFLFIQEGGFPGHPDSINSWMHEFEQQNNLAPIHPHKIRHTVASELFYKGLRIEEIAELLGHANSSVTEAVYVEIRKEAKIRASEALMQPFGLKFGSAS